MRLVRYADTESCETKRHEDQARYHWMKAEFGYEDSAVSLQSIADVLTSS